MTDQVSRVLGIYTYASLDDIRSNTGGEAKYPCSLYEHYANIVAETGKKTLNKLFSPKASYNCAYDILFSRFLKEITEIDIDAGDTPASLADKLKERADGAGSISYGEYVMRSIIHKRAFEKILETAYDPKKYVTAKIEETLSKYRGNELLITIVSQCFNNYLKMVAQNTAEHIWYNKTMNYQYGFAVAHMASTGLCQSGCDELFADLENIEAVKAKAAAEKAAKRVAAGGAKPKPRRKKADTVDAVTTATTATPIATPIATPTATPVATAPVQNIADAAVSNYINGLGI